MAITIIEPTASNAATAATAAQITSPNPYTADGMPMALAKPSSKVVIFSGRQKMNVSTLISRHTRAMRGNSTGNPASATGSNNDSQPCALNQIRLSRLPISAC